MNNQEKDTIRINKFLASTGACSRREADKLIESGKVLINNKKAQLGDTVTLKDKITLKGEIVKPEIEKIYIALHKPFGVITTTDKDSTNTVLDYIDIPQRIYPIGRLDVESSGLILLTNDGEIVNKLLKSRNKQEKEYLVTLDKPITKECIQRLTNGIKIDNKKTLPAKVTKISPNQITITIIQGLNRQIRHMCTAIGYEVKILKRIRFANINLDKLPRGKWRFLTEKEIESIKNIK